MELIVQPTPQGCVESCWLGCASHERQPFNLLTQRRRNAEDDLSRALFVLHAVQVNRIEFSLNALGKKKAPTPLQVRGRSLRLLAVWGTITGLVVSDAPTPDLGSMLRDVTASTKRLSSHSKAAGPRNQRLCLVPHTCRFLGQQSLGIELAVKWSSLHLVPTLPFREGGRPV